MVHGKAGENATENTPARGGYGGYAGIHVPENAILNLSGDGKVIALSGDAGNGGDGYGHPYGGGRRWTVLVQELVETVVMAEMVQVLWKDMIE